MKIALVSDLHLEEGNNLDRIDRVEDEHILIVAGDLDVGASNVFRALNILSKRFRDIIYVPGNHEYYGSSLPEFNSQLKLLLKDKPNIHFLDNQYLDLDGVRFIGSTLWTNFRYNPIAMLAAKTMIKDFKLIRDFTPEQSAKEFYLANKYIQFAYEGFKGPKVIITHFMPAKECINTKYSSENLINNYFSNDMIQWIEVLDNTTWVFGHTHDKTNLKIGETRLIAHPRGYNEDNQYKPLIVKV